MQKSEGSKIDAALCLCDLVQSSIGGNTSIKCIQDDNEELYISETSMFLKALDIQHPVGQYLVSVCQSFHHQHGSGVKTLLCMIGILLRLSRNLRQQGVPLDVILKNLDKVMDDCCNKADEIKIQFSPKLNSENINKQNKDISENTNSESINPVSIASKAKNLMNKTGGEPIVLDHTGHSYVTMETSSHDVDFESDDEFDACFAIHDECSTSEKVKTSQEYSGSEICSDQYHKSPQSNSSESKISSSNKYCTIKTYSQNTEEKMSSDKQLPAIGTNSGGRFSKQQLPDNSTWFPQECTGTAYKSKLTLSKTDALLKAITSSSHKVSSSSILSSSRYGKQLLNKQSSENKRHVNDLEECCLEKEREELPKTSENTKESLRKGDNQGFIKQSLGLSHGSENMMMCILEALELTNGTSKDQIRLHSVCVDGSLSQVPVMVPGIVLKIRSQFIPAIGETKHHFTAVIINGDLSQNYRHIGYKNTLKSNLVLSGPVTDVGHISTWLNMVEDIICLYSIDCLIVRGTVSPDVVDLCLAKGVLILEKVQLKSLQSLADQFGVTMVTYITDVYEANLFSIFLEPLRDDWTQCFHVIVKSGNNDDNQKTVVMCHPSQNGRDLLEQEFHRCKETMQSALRNGYVLPGYGQTEEIIAQILTELSETSTDLYLSSMYDEVARGLQEFVLLVRLNADKNGRDTTGPSINVGITQGERIVANYVGRNDVIDDYRTKISGWRTALNTAMTILQIDSFIILDQSTALL